MRNIVRLTFLHYHAAVLVIAALIASLSVAQLAPGNFTQSNGQDGLPGSQGNCPLPDKFSYVWLGAIHGLAQYNSFQFKRSDTNRNNTYSISIKGLIVASLFEHKAGSIRGNSSMGNLNKYNSITKLFRQYTFHYSIDYLVNTLKRITAQLTEKGTVFENSLIYNID